MAPKTFDRTCSVFAGIEIENTQFKGMRTIFFSRASLFKAYQHLVFTEEDYEPVYEHVYFMLNNPSFGVVDDFTLMQWVAKIVGQKRYVTFEVNAIDSERFTVFRQKFLSYFCLLIVVKVPRFELGAYAVKVVPRQAFSDASYEDGVATLPSSHFMSDSARTKWSEYNADNFLAYEKSS